MSEEKKIDLCHAGQVFLQDNDVSHVVSRDPGQKAPPSDNETSWNRQGYRVSPTGGDPIGLGAFGGTSRGSNPNEPPVEKGKRDPQGRTTK